MKSKKQETPVKNRRLDGYASTSSEFRGGPWCIRLGLPLNPYAAGG